MEFINRIELVGIVGMIRKQTYCGRVVANFSVVTEYCYKDKTGGAVVETSWHNVVAWNSDNISCLDAIDRGSHVHVIGRIRMRRYSDSNGESRISFDVVASSVEVLSIQETQ